MFSIALNATVLGKLWRQLKEAMVGLCTKPCSNKKAPQHSDTIPVLSSEQNHTPQWPFCKMTCSAQRLVLVYTEPVLVYTKPVLVYTEPVLKSF